MEKDRRKKKKVRGQFPGPSGKERKFKKSEEGEVAYS